jgi:hypothetical protein
MFFASEKTLWEKLAKQPDFQQLFLPQGHKGKHFNFRF